MSDKEMFLKPCPFCGGDDLLISTDTIGVVICKRCGAQGGNSYEVRSNSIKRTDAIRKWNTRGGGDDLK